MAEALGWDDGSTYAQNNRLDNQSHRPLGYPAPTVTAGNDSANRGFTLGEEFRAAAVPEVAALQTYPTMLQSNYSDGGVKGSRGERLVTQPASTITSKSGSAKWDKVSRLSLGEAAVLQAYPTASWGYTNRPAMSVTSSVARGLGGGSGAQRQVKRRWLTVALSLPSMLSLMLMQNLRALPYLKLGYYRPTNVRSHSVALRLNSFSKLAMPFHPYWLKQF